MSDITQQQFPDELNHIYATLNQHDVEQFYAGYQLWYTRQRITTLQEQIGSLHQQISENAERLQQVQPPAVAFATLARLQANGVNEIGLLDRMLERGEEWLDLTMQRLDYCEQLDFIHDNYAQWCEHALEGAYDWIDSMRDAYDDTTPQPVVTTEVDEVSVEATEELLLRKLTSEEEEEVTLKRPAVSLSPSVPVTAETPPEPGLQASPEEEPVTALEAQEAGSPQGLPLQGPEMAFPAETNAEPDAGTSFVSTEQADESKYVEFAPAVEAGTEESGSPQGPEMSFPVQADAEADASTSFVSTEQADESKYVEFAPAVEAGTEESGSPQGPEMSSLVQVDPQADSLPASSEQVGEGEYVEFAPAIEAGMEDTGQAQGSDLSFPVQADMEADSSLLPGEQVDEQEYLEFAPPAEFETEEARPAQGVTVQESEIPRPVETVAESDLSLTSNELTDKDEHTEFTLPSETSPHTKANVDTELPPVPAEETPLQEHTDHIPTREASLPAEATPTADASPAPVDQITSLEHVEPVPLSENSYLDTPAWMDLAATDVEQEEAIPSKADTTHDQIDVQVSIPEYRELPAPEVKSQRERSFWRRLLAIFWP